MLEQDEEEEGKEAEEGGRKGVEGLRSEGHSHECQDSL